MRFGNTPPELASSHWEPYKTTKEWFLKTGPGSKTVYGEFRLSDGTTIKKNINSIPDILTNEFNTNQQGWWSYNFDEGTGQNVFFPLTWRPDGGINNSGYVWTDDSRWAIDTPEEPDSILALTTYTDWQEIGPVDLKNAIITVNLKGDNLELKGSNLYFWALDNETGARWHFTDYPIKIPIGKWEDKIQFKLSNDESRWHRSWGPESDLNMTLSGTDSFGFSFRGFPENEEVTGKLSMDQFEIKLNN